MNGVDYQVGDGGQIIINETGLDADEVRQLRAMGFEIAEQGSEAWHEERLGKVTASEVIKVIARVYKTQANPEGRPSDTYYTYMNELLAERLTRQAKTFSTRGVEWGKSHEEEAAALYQELTSADVQEVTFQAIDDLEAGASSDRLVDEDGQLEIKCPNTDTLISFVEFLEEKSKIKPRDWDKYYAQMQMQLWANGRKWSDFMLYDPRADDGEAMYYIKRFDRDEAFIADMKAKVIRFLAELDDKERWFREFRKERLVEVENEQ